MTKRSLLLITLAFLAACGGPEWRTSEAFSFTLGPIENYNTLLAVGTTFGTDYQLRSYDRRSGVFLWGLELGSWENCRELFILNKNAIVGCTSLLIVVDTSTGREQWRIDTELSLAFLRVTADLLVIGLEQPAGLEISAFHLLTGGRLWHRILPTGFRLLGNHVPLIFCDGSETLELDPAYGTTRWKLYLPDAPEEVYSTGDALVVNSAGALTGLDPNSGEIRWRIVTEGLTSPALEADLLCYSHRGTFSCLDPLTGKEYWRRHLSGVLAPPFIGPFAVYVHTAGGTLYCLSKTNGALEWQRAIGSPSANSAWTDSYYAWYSDTELHIVDLVSKTVRVKHHRSKTREDGGTYLRGIRRTLSLDGSGISGIDQDFQLFRLELDR